MREVVRIRRRGKLRHTSPSAYSGAGVVASGWIRFRSGEYFGKIIADKKTGRVLGANYICHSAGEVIHEVALAMKAGIHAREIGQTIHAYPTMAEGVRWAATGLEFD
ncbi:MAG: hypothetical protein IH958_01065 [Chloroflexi bacterium]|nr:hypothetical protein [Chloroflexota bacterium]